MQYISLFQKEIIFDINDAEILHLQHKVVRVIYAALTDVEYKSFFY